MTSTAVGIDLGTTNSCVAIYRNNNVEIIENELGDRVTPSWVTFAEDMVLTGKESMEEFFGYPKTTVFEAKRLIGQKFNDPKVQEDIERLPYHIFNDLNTPKIKITYTNGKPVEEYYPEEISAFILRKMREIAEARLKKSITRAVITVPAYFNDAQRQATKDAATIAGFETVNVINEPTAAAMAFNDEHKKPYKRNIMVYDFGGGTFDVSIVTVGRGKCEVKSTKGDSHLGGTDIDMNLVKYVKEDFEKQFGRQMKSDDFIERRLKQQCEKAKKVLSGTRFQTNIELDYLSGEDHPSFSFTRSRLEKLNQELFRKTLQIVDECLQESGLKKENIDEAVLVGGSSRIPKIQQMLEEYFGKEKINKGINPDEAVAYGAAIHASNLAGDKNEVYDVTSLSLGTNTYGDLMSVIIPRNTPVPAKSIKRYQTIMDNQTTMEFPIYQGEREIASENFELGNFTMTDLTEAPAKAVKVEICFQLDAEGQLHVSAMEINSDNRKEIAINVEKNGLSKEKIQQRIEEAKINKEKETKRRKFDQAHHRFETLLDDLKAHAEKFEGQERETIMNEHDEIYKWLDKAKIDDLPDFPTKEQKLKDLLGRTPSADN